MYFLGNIKSILDETSGGEAIVQNGSMRSKRMGSRSITHTDIPTTLSHCSTHTALYTQHNTQNVYAPAQEAVVDG